MQHLVQQTCSGATHRIGSLNDRTQWHASEGSGQRIIVDADQRHLLGDSNSGGQAGLQ